MDGRNVAECFFEHSVDFRSSCLLQIDVVGWCVVWGGDKFCVDWRWSRSSHEDYRRVMMHGNISYTSFSYLEVGQVLNYHYQTRPMLQLECQHLFKGTLKKTKSTYQQDKFTIAVNTVILSICHFLAIYVKS